MTALAFALTALTAASPVAPRVVAVVTGVAQDGGVPQANCRCEHCTAARRDSGRRHQVASLALLDLAARRTFLIDATPDLPLQLDRLAADPELPLPEGRTPLDGILLTHAHVGHYAGLIHFGREALAARGLELFTTARMAGFLETNAPWSELVRRGHVCLTRIAPDQSFALAPALHARALLVPHRDELSDTVAWVIAGPHRQLLWLPDIDRWERWDRGLEAILAEVDVAFLDATFYAASELPGRSIADIPHPLVTETVARLRAMGKARRARVYLIHLNHSNPLFDPDDPERRALAAEGIEVASEGMRIEL